MIHARVEVIPGWLVGHRVAQVLIQHIRRAKVGRQEEAILGPPGHGAEAGRRNDVSGKRLPRGRITDRDRIARRVAHFREVPSPQSQRRNA